MTYTVKEIYYTLQGEGANTGRPAVFLRFAGCNLWSGREEDRATAICQFCDTDFVGGTKYASAELLAAAVAGQWFGNGTSQRFVVITGGEPLLQLDRPLIGSLHALGFEIAIETNGTIDAPEGLDWICVSPKAGTALVQRSGDELKVVYPQPLLDPASFERLDFRWFFVQPMDGPDIEQNTELAARYCLEHPRWRLSLQTHKLLGIR
ncbi:MAG TPA: 7-carboxy-7-deazaguanine synthase [Gemmatimonadales bacterium]|jgi:7-carboxy-7-deazaguanine synthase (Cx14CxxC type)|nr:7-carboxy-7-deazaguanine synthase [Gemmatimonadales bacterium]